MGIRTDLLVTEEIAESSDLRATPFEFERAKRVEAALSILEGKWKIVVLNRLHIGHNLPHSQLIPSAQDGTGATLTLHLQDHRWDIYSVHIAFGASFGSSNVCAIVRAKFGKNDRKRF